MARVVAFSLFVLAAYDWPTPFTDRAGTALLGLAFLVLAVGRVSSDPRPSLFKRAPADDVTT